ncbi:aromatic-ring hydroxylase C-terminal domain-containing protein [Streptomyces diastatochromogenes]|uniref:aromatic-ring hydroxylase C-terminal domain-containing protein n=1 Tax=Streptomyces diastatochromogenes TaxID=42236 RepID=UPI0036AEBA7A
MGDTRVAAGLRKGAPGPAQPHGRRPAQCRTGSGEGRPPSLRLSDGRALFDHFHRGFTLLRFADHDVTALTEAAAVRDVPLGVVDVRDTHARALYERDLVLVRPDQHVAWRGDTPPADPHYVIGRVRGAHH